jgi:outer membrane lipoprotein-sorting protein
MASNRRTVTGLVCLLIALCAWRAAGQDDAEEVLGNVRKKYDAMNDAELRFTQKVRFPLAKVEQTVSGTLLFKKESKVRPWSPTARRCGPIRHPPTRCSSTGSSRTSSP